MEEKNVNNVVEMNGENAGVQDTSSITGTDYVEPQGKVRKVVKIALTALAGAALFVAGLLTGRATDKDDDEEKTDDNGEDSKE